jgi:hypothetical protein
MPKTVWGQDASAWGVNAQGAVDGETSTADQSMAYLLRNAGTEQRAPYRGFEDKAVLFLGNNAGKVWLGIAVLAVLVVRYVQ